LDATHLTNRSSLPVAYLAVSLTIETPSKAFEQSLFVLALINVLDVAEPLVKGVVLARIIILNDPSIPGKSLSHLVQIYVVFRGFDPWFCLFYIFSIFLSFLKLLL